MTKINHDQDMKDEEQLSPCPISLDHCYSLPFTEEMERQEILNHDHGYTTMSPGESRPLTPPTPQLIKSPIKPKKPKAPVIRRPPTPELPKIAYKERDIMGEMRTLYEFLTQGIDLEDISYLRKSYECMLQDDNQSYWLNDTHWVDHPDILFKAIFKCNILFNLKMF
jgi:histone-lysine N-methyltransferase SETD1